MFSVPCEGVSVLLRRRGFASCVPRLVPPFQRSCRSFATRNQAAVDELLLEILEHLPQTVMGFKGEMKDCSAIFEPETVISSFRGCQVWMFPGRVSCTTCTIGWHFDSLLAAQHSFRHKVLYYWNTGRHVKPHRASQRDVMHRLADRHSIGRLAPARGPKHLSLPEYFMQRPPRPKKS